MYIMSFLIIGLGSMGKRRIRCLKSLGFTDITGVDTKEERLQQSIKEYGVNTIKHTDLIETLQTKKFTAIIISVPPDIHHIFMKLAIQYDTPFFVEASVLDTDFDFIKKESFRKGISCMPSMTMMFHPAIMIIETLLPSLGKISNIIYHSGQYLPDWHTYESVADFYVSKKEMGGCREIVPFELTWITKLFGFPSFIKSFVGKTIHINGAPDIDDTYNFLFKYSDFLMTITVDVVSRMATRRLVINGDTKQLIWDWTTNKVIVDNKYEHTEYPYNVVTTENYNKNITEQMYVDELNHFITHITLGSRLNHSLYYDHTVLRLLYAIENESPLVQFGILINVRLNSTRLPRKQFTPVLNMTLLELLVKRLEIRFPNIPIIIASSDNEVNYELKDHFLTYFGSEDNIPLRQYDCAKYYGLTHIISIDGDDPFASVDMCEYFINNPKQICKSVGLPLGMNVITYSTSHLQQSLKGNEKKIFNTGWTEIFNTIEEYIIPITYPPIRCTLDYPIDATFFQQVINDYGPSILYANDNEIINFILGHSYQNINKDVDGIYWENFNKNKIIERQ